MATQTPTSSSKTKLIIGIGIAGAIVAVGVGAYEYLASQSCSSNPASPCSPYIQAYKTCLSEYIDSSKQFLAENTAAGYTGGFTAEQQAYLASLTTCMNNAAKNIYQQTALLNKPIEEAILAIAAAITAVMIVKGLLSTYSTLKISSTQKLTGNTGANAARNSVLKQIADDGDLPPDAVDSYITQNESITTDEVNSDETLISDYQDIASQIFTTEEELAAAEEEIDTTIAAEQVAMSDTTDDVDEDLSTLFE